MTHVEVIQATVSIERKGAAVAQGVLVPGGLVLTAAHCIKWSGTGGMALGEYLIETIATETRKKLRVTPISVDPVSDIAVLGALDEQEFYDEVIAFEKWVEATAPVPLAVKLPRHRKTIDALIRTHRKKWVNAKVTNYILDFGGTMAIRASKQIEGGTSGGPIVTPGGELLGVASIFSDESGESCDGTMPIACLALPRWVLGAILRSQKATK